MMETVRTSETSVDNHFTRQYNPEDSSEHHTRRRENLKSHEDDNVEDDLRKVGIKRWRSRTTDRRERRCIARFLQKL
jgi:hypothetical protein